MCKIVECNKPNFIVKPWRKDRKNYRKQSLCRKHWIKAQLGIMNKLTGREHTAHRKGYCENCKETYYTLAQKLSNFAEMAFKDIIRRGHQFLTVDHINGIHEDNRPENLMTLCHNCHFAKSIDNGDHAPNRG